MFARGLFAERPTEACGTEGSCRASSLHRVCPGDLRMQSSVTCPLPFTTHVLPIDYPFTSFYQSLLPVHDPFSTRLPQFATHSPSFLYPSQFATHLLSVCYWRATHLLPFITHLRPMRYPFTASYYLSTIRSLCISYALLCKIIRTCYECTTHILPIPYILPIPNHILAIYKWHACPGSDKLVSSSSSLSS